jgi:quercetin dioxygenase-like cupin family protein
MRHSSGVLVLATAGFVVGGVMVGRAQQAAAPAAIAPCKPAAVAEHIMLSPTDLKWVDAPPSLPAGAKFALIEGDPTAANQLVAFRLKLPPGYKIPPHFHPADEHVTVISGTLQMGMGDKWDDAKLKPYPAGSFLVMPAKSTHFPMAKGETILQVHAIGPWGITYVNPSDDPRQQQKKKASL